MGWLYRHFPCCISGNKARWVKSTTDLTTIGTLGLHLVDVSARENSLTKESVGSSRN